MIKLTEIYDNLWYAVGKIEFIEFMLIIIEIMTNYSNCLKKKRRRIERNKTIKTYKMLGRVKKSIAIIKHNFHN